MSDQDIWSRGIRSAPRYEHRSGKNEFLGYLVQRDFAVTLTDFRPYARLLDGLFALHIEEIRRTFPSFSKADVETDKLRTAALADAWKKAEDMAAKLKTRVVTVFAVSPVEPGGIKDSILN